MKKFLAGMKRLLKPTKKKTVSAVAAVVIASASIWGAMVIPTKIAEAKMARDCDNNAIMECGAVNAAEFVKKLKANKTGDLDNIYAAYGFNSADYARFEKTAKMGSVTKDGKVILDGKVVADSAESIGRQNMSGSHTKTINGKKYYERSTKVSFASSSIPAMIMMNGDQVEFVALTSCGNPVKNHPKGKPPVYQCEMLNKEAVPGKDDTFAFSSKVVAQNGAKLSKVVYDFGDGQQVTKTNPAEKIQHTYKPGKYTAKVTAYFTVNGETKTHTRTECTKPVEVKAPPAPVYACTALKATVVPPSKNKYTFVATAKAENGATFKSAEFNFGDGQKQTVNGLATTHEYAKDGTYKAFAILTFNVGTTTKTTQCEVSVTPETPKPPVYECTGLSVTQKSRTEFSFKASSKVENAELLRYRYAVHFSEGVVAEDRGPNETFNYTVPKEGDYTINAQAIVKVDGVEKETPITAACSKQFTVKPQEVPPVAECTALNATLKSGTRTTYEYAVSTKVEGNAKVINYTYDYGDGQTQTLTTPTANHTYAKAGEWKSKVTVTFEVNGEQVQKTSAACAANTPVQPAPPEECKPGIPVGDARCTDYCKPGIPVGDSRCQEECKPGVPMGDSRCQDYCKPGIPMGDARCVDAPKELPQTGAAALGSAFGISSLAGAGYYWRHSRRSLIQRLMNRK